jgi:4'-phosphopantetheinyl transferase
VLLHDRPAHHKASVPIQFGSNEIHFWHLSADVDASTLATLQATLSELERTQAQRFHFEIDTRRFIARRGLVRTVLAKYLDSAAQALAFDLGIHGKPLLASAITTKPLHFNYSYSGEALLLAVSERYELGVDIEAPRSIAEASEIALQNFSPAEQRILANVTQVTETFFTCWTAKEAVIKALGSGLSRPLNDFTTLTDTGALQRELNVHDGDRGRLQRIRLLDVPAPNFRRATLAVLLPSVGQEPVAIERHWVC